jgi:hypothetical protein
MILSSADHLDPMSMQGKYAWCQKNLGLSRDRVILVPRSPDKAKYAGPNAILIDDFWTNVNTWKEHGGLGVLYRGASTAVGEVLKYVKELF